VKDKIKENLVEELEDIWTEMVSEEDKDIPMPGI
jgi:hypothetical protein